MTKSEFAKIIDHTALKPDTNETNINQLCEEALKFNFGAVCVSPTWVPLAAKKLAGSLVKVVAVVGFPHGSTLTSVKAFEASQVISCGADEIDMVINIGALISGHEDIVFIDIESVVQSAIKVNPRVIVKVILETAFLSDGQKTLACKIAEKAGANYIKTSTGFATSGANVHDVSLIRGVVENRLGIKAAGGIRDLSTAKAIIAAGATRIGCSSSVSIFQEYLKEA